MEKVKKKLGSLRLSETEWLLKMDLSSCAALFFTGDSNILFHSIQLKEKEKKIRIEYEMKIQSFSG